MHATDGDIPPAALFDRLLELTLLLGADMDRELARVGLTPSRAHLIWVLADEGPSMQQHLAKQLGVSARNVTALVDALVESGFVSRQPHPSDRRAFLVTLTSQGDQTVERLRRERLQLADDLFAPFPNAERTVLLSAFSEVSTRLDELIRAAASQDSVPAE